MNNTNENNNQLLDKINKLEAELQLYKTIIDNVPISVFAKDVQNNYTYLIWNKELEKVFGTKSDKILGIHDYQLFEKKDADYFRNYDESVMNGREIVDIPMEELQTVEGPKLVHTRKIPIYDHNNNPHILLGCLEDITGKIKTENELKESENKLRILNNDKDRFISILAHDLRNPFNTLLGFSDLLLENINAISKNEISEQIQIINQISHKTYNLLEDLLLWIQSQSGKIKFEPVQIDFNNLVTDILHNYDSNSKNIEILVQNDLNVSVCADVNMLKTILRNLISNAFKFTNNNGSIKISAKSDNDNAIISVTDNGIGINAEDVNKLFDFSKKFSSLGTNNEKGSGLGLLICSEFIEKHNGKIWAKSTFGIGSEFTFTIPLFR